MVKRLNELEKGDKVAYTNQWYSTGFHSGYQIWQQAIVEKDTNTQLTVNGERFNRRNGIRIGDDPYSDSKHKILPWSEEIEREIEETQRAIAEHKDRQAALRVIEKTNFRDLSTKNLQRIAEIIKG